MSWLGVPGGSESKESVCNAGDLGLILGSGRSPGEGNGNPRQYSCLENPMTEEPGRLQSMGLQRVGHNCTTNTHTHILAIVDSVAMNIGMKYLFE